MGVPTLEWGLQSNGIQIPAAGKRAHILSAPVQWDPNLYGWEERAHPDGSSPVGGPVCTGGGSSLWGLYTGGSRPVVSRSLWLEGESTHWEVQCVGSLHWRVQWDPDPYSWSGVQIPVAGRRVPTFGGSSVWSLYTGVSNPVGPDPCSWKESTHTH